MATEVLGDPQAVSGHVSGGKGSYFEKRWEWVVGADGIDPDGDLEIGSDEEEEVDIDMERDSDLASLNQLLQARQRRSDP
jgi:hypothetical protein